jgi:hypothetical protein
MNIVTSVGRVGRPSLLLPLLALALATSGGCRDQQSFVVVTVQSVDATPVAGVVELRVSVTNGNSTKDLTYPVPADQAPLTITGTLDPITATIGKTLSISFTSGHSDDVAVVVDARDASACRVGHGAGTTTIKKGGVGALTVALDHTSGPCDGDGGADDGGPVTFPGCDPAALTCGANMTCAVNCMALQGQCVAAGAMPGGSLCTLNTNCAPGTQCFTYVGPSCSVGACLKYCKTDDDCTSMGAGSVCQGNVPCARPDGGVVLTTYHTCTFGCDPRSAATTGCPTGLHCFLVDTMDQVDCTCTEATRTHTEGQACTRGADCVPGLVCDQSTGKCQKICQVSASSSDCSAGQTCTMLTNDQLYGVCLP